MIEFCEKEDLSVVTIVIPQSRLTYCLSMVLSLWPYYAIQFDCRGTMISEHWFQAFLPIMNPECEYLQFIVKDSDVQEFMAFCVDVNELHLPGRGAIFSAKCNRMFSTSKAIMSYENTTVIHETHNENNQFKNNVYAIYAVIQSGKTDQAIKAAIQAGSHGPVVYFVEGRGTRDRAGWLKITKKPYEEVLMMLVEDIDRDSVKEALVSASRVGTLGGGVIFDMPLDNALVNLPTSIGNKKQRSSNEQITAALDQLMGNTDWRKHRALDTLLNKTQNIQQEGNDEERQVLLNAILPRKYANEFLDQILIIGIHGANVIYSKLFSVDDADDEKGVQIHHEVAHIRMVVSEEMALGFLTEMKDFVTEQDYTGAILYQQELSEVIRYQKKQKQKQENDYIYRGAI